MKRFIVLSIILMAFTSLSYAGSSYGPPEERPPVINNFNSAPQIKPEGDPVSIKKDSSEYIIKIYGNGQVITIEHDGVIHAFGSGIL